jgi:hypothetical protein
VKIPKLQEHESAFVERDLFLHALLGVLSVGKRFEAWLEAVMPVPTSPERVEGGAAPSRDVALVLGAISFWKKAGAHVRALALEALPVERGRVSPRRRVDGPPRILLR